MPSRSMRVRHACGVIVFALICSTAGYAQTRTFDIYWIDVEGGAATLIVSPSGESLLVDTGWENDDRDAKRIFEAARQAGYGWILGIHSGIWDTKDGARPLPRIFVRGDDAKLDFYLQLSRGRSRV